MPIATNPSTGEVVYLDDKGAWAPAQTSVNPETREMLAYDGKAWSPVPASKGVMGYIDDAVRSIANGITFGWADEFAAKMDEVTGRGGGYSDNLKKEQARDAQIPVTIQLPGEIAGAVGTTVLTMPLAGVKALAAASSKIPQWMRFAGLGTVEGSVAGAGGATEDNRTGGAAMGAAIGAPLGAIAPSVVQGVTAAARGVRNAVAPQSGAVADVGRALVRDEMTPATFADRFMDSAAQRPGVATVADAGGENVRGLVERVAQTPGAGRTKVIPALTERQQQQATRISSDLRDLTGTERSAFQTTEEVISERATAATPLYQAAYDAGDFAVWSPGLERLSSSPTVQDAMKGAVRIWRDNAVADGFGALNPSAIVDRNAGALKFLEGKVPVLPNLQFWDYTKKIVDDQIGTAIRNGQDQKARTLTRLAGALRTELDNVVPDYRAARDAWAGPSAYLNAIDDGRKVMSKAMSADEFTATFRALTPSEQEAYRIGAISSIISKMGNDPAKLADMTKYLRAPEVRAKVAAMMPSEQSAQAWAKRLDFEVRSSELTGQALGNSATARRLAEQGDAKGIVGDLVLDSLLSGPSSVSFLRRVFTSGPRWLRDTLRSKTDKELADLLTNPDRAADLPKILDRAARARQTGSARTAPASTAAGVVTAE
jgi:hypothetical protein